MLAKIFIVLFVLLAGLACVIAVQPTDYTVMRTATIAAPPESVFQFVNDFHRWDGWSPWAKLDPNMKVAYSGAESGTGAIYTWTGNSDVGEGRMTILESRPNEKIRIKLDFLKPFESTAVNEFTMAPDGGGTRVEWSMAGQNNFMSKAFCLFMGGMDKMIGPDFEKGLRQLKATAESPK